MIRQIKNVNYSTELKFYEFVTSVLHYRLIMGCCDVSNALVFFFFFYMMFSVDFVCLFCLRVYGPVNS